MNSINNLILRTFLKGNATSRKDFYGIEVINHPMNLTRAQVDEELTYVVTLLKMLLNLLAIFK